MMGPISLCICPPLLQRPGGNIHRARHSQNHGSSERIPDENSESGFSRTYCITDSDMSTEVILQDPCSFLLFYFLGSL